MYFITTYDIHDDDTRCVGYYKKFEDAEKVVLNNICDLWETCYDYVVIEEIPEGLYQYDMQPKWYKYNKILDQYEPCGIPHSLKNNIGFAIG